MHYSIIFFIFTQLFMCITKAADWHFFLNPLCALCDNNRGCSLISFPPWTNAGDYICFKHMQPLSWNKGIEEIELKTVKVWAFKMKYNTFKVIEYYWK